MQIRSGIWTIENLDLTQLVADKAYVFLFVWSPLKIKSGTGSPGDPIAMYQSRALGDANPPWPGRPDCRFC